MVGRSELVAAADRLRVLLLNKPEYRSFWLARARRIGTGLNIDAVSNVLVEHTWQNPGFRDPASTRSMRDRVRRAFAAEVLTLETLQLFIDGFSMSQPDADDLVALLATPTAPGYWRSPPNRGYRTISLHELHRVGAAGVPVDHRTVHVIAALRDDVSEHLYVFDTDVADVRAVAGVKVGEIEPCVSVPGYWQSRMTFTKPMMAGDVRIFEYETRFRYRTAPAPEMRRGSTYRLESLAMRVEFDPAHHPAEIWWCSWAEPAAPPHRLEQATLDEYSAVHRHVSSLEGSLVGFTWTW